MIVDGCSAAAAVKAGGVDGATAVVAGVGGFGDGADCCTGRNVVL